MSYNDSIIEAYKKRGYKIIFTHVPTGKTTSFPSFLQSMSDSYSATWTSESVFGRMDPIYTYQITTRTISFSIAIPNADEKEAESNLSNVRELTKFLYPTFQNNTNATTISKAPLVRIKFSNLIGKGADGTGGGLLGKIQSVSVTPTVDVGFFDIGTRLFPKELTLSISFDVLHEEDPSEFDNEIYEDPQDLEPVLEEDLTKEQKEEEDRAKAALIAAGIQRTKELQELITTEL